jgi:hypothetical protein
MTQEIQRVWRGAGIEFHWAVTLPPGEPIADRVITVFVTDDHFGGPPIRSGALGAVPTVEGRMRQVVYVSPSAVKRLMATAGVSQLNGQFADLYARTVGRVIAHGNGPPAVSLERASRERTHAKVVRRARCSVG